MDPLKFPQALDFFPDQTERDLVLNAMQKAGAKTWPEMFSCRFIEPGVVFYEAQNEGEPGTMLLVTRDAMAKMRSSFVGRPVVNEVHRPAHPGNFKEIADGVVTRVWHNAEDGWDWCDYMVWDEATKRNCRSGAYSVSCAYKPTDVAEGGEHHNVKYDAGLVDGLYTHLAVVRNPRYEGARIICNSKGENDMKLQFWKKDEKKNAKTLDPKMTVLIDGKPVTIEDLLNAHREKLAAEAKPEEVEKDTIIELDGVEMPFETVANSYRDKQNADKKDDPEDEEKKKKEKEEKENASKAAAKKAADDKKAEELRNAADFRGNPQQPVVVTREDRIAAGKKGYGSKS